MPQNNDRASAGDGPVVVGIDMGTSSVRAVAFDLGGRRVAARSCPTPMRKTETGGEFDPEAIWQAVVANLAGLAAALGGRPVAGIAVASIGESCVLIDEAGRPLAPSIIWFDNRTAGEALAIEKALGRERIFALTGHAVEPIFTLAKLMWMRAHWPEAMAKAKHLLLMADWIAFRLSGARASEPMLASRTLFYDIRRREWSAELLKLAGLTPDIAAPLVASGSALGMLRPEVKAATGLAAEPIVGVGGHDHIVGSLAAGLNESGVAIDSIGTAEALLLATEAPLSDPALIGRGYVQGAIETDRRLSFIVGSLLSAGGAIEWVRSSLGAPEQERLIAEATAVPPGARGVVFVPHLAGGAPPYPDPQARGAFLGLTQRTTPAELYRAALEGVALQLSLALDGMTALAGIDDLASIRVIGGVSRNPLFLSIKANVFARPLHVIDEPEMTALGAALLAGVAAGVFPSLDQALAGLERTTHIVEPDEKTAERYAALSRLTFAPIQESMRPIGESLAAFAGADRPAG